MFWLQMNGPTTIQEEDTASALAQTDSLLKTSGIGFWSNGFSYKLAILPKVFLLKLQVSSQALPLWTEICIPLLEQIESTLAVVDLALGDDANA